MKKSLMSLVRAVFISATVLAPAATLAATSGTIGIGNQNGGFIFSWGDGTALCTTTVCGVASTIIYTINFVLVPLLFAIAFITFLYGVFKKYIWSKGDESAVEEGHKLILWGIIGFVVMVSVWGLVNVVANTFGLAGYVAPVMPTSIPPVI